MSTAHTKRYNARNVKQCLGNTTLERRRNWHHSSSDRYTLSIENLIVYHFGSRSGSLNVAKDREIAKLLHPEPDLLVKELMKVKTFCIILSDGLSELQRESAALKERLAKLESASGGEGSVSKEELNENKNAGEDIGETEPAVTEAIEPIPTPQFNPGETQQHLRYDGPPSEVSMETPAPPLHIDQGPEPEPSQPQQQPTASDVEPQLKPKLKTGPRGRNSRASARLSNVSTHKGTEDEEANTSIDEFRFEASVSGDEIKAPEESAKKRGRRPRKKRTPSVEVIGPEEFQSQDGVRQNSGSAGVGSANIGANEERKKRLRTTK